MPADHPPSGRVVTTRWSTAQYSRGSTLHGVLIEVDLFASHSNNLVLRYYSKFSHTHNSRS